LWYWKFVMQAYCFCIFLMEGRHNVWSPWYLMPEDKPSKVECKFCNNVISYYKDRMLFQLGYWYDGNGWVRVTMCSKVMTTKIHGSSNNNDQNRWPSDCNDKIQSALNCRLWFWSMSIYHAHFRSPPKNY
jgi:hypothetical protein